MTSWRTLLCTAVMLAATACGKSESSPTGGDDAGSTADVGAIDADAAPPVDENTCGVSTGEPTVAVIRRIDFVGQEGGVTHGLNHDGHVSTSSDAEGCFRGDLRDEDGNEGIDNQFAFIVPALLAAAGDGLTSAIQRAINEGAVLLLLSVDRYDDVDDECVEVELFRGADRPTIGGLGLIEPGQTFDRDATNPSFEFDVATAEDGWITAGPVTIGLPMELAQFELFLTIDDATLVFEVAPDGTMYGFIAGALLVDEIVALLDEIEDETDLIPTIRQIVIDNADLAPDEEGVCQKLSITLEFEATSAFVFPAEADE